MVFHPNFKSKVGNTYGKIKVEKLVGCVYPRGTHTIYLYDCYCGYCNNNSLIRTGSLNSKLRKSCGCVRTSHGSNKRRISISKRIKIVENNTNYKVIDTLGVNSHRGKWLFNCENHGQFLAKLGDICSMKSGCPSCAHRGINLKLPCLFYINIIKNNGKPIALKYGVTTQKIKTRVTQLNLNANFKVENLFFMYLESGYVAVEIEKDIKNNLGNNYISKEDLPVGYTETTNIDNLPKIINLIKNRGK